MNAEKISSYKLVADILSDIVVAIVENEKQLTLLSVANYIDHYRAYLQLCTSGTEWEGGLVDFEIFVSDQALINVAAAYLSRENEETVVPLIAL